MTLYGFVDVKEGSGSDLQQLLDLVGRLSQSRPVILKLDRGVRPRVEEILQGLPGADHSRINLVEKDCAGSSVIPDVHGVGFCVVRDTEGANDLGENQVSVFFRSKSA